MRDRVVGMKLLLLSVSAGAGHVRAAQALEEAARRLRPEADVRHEDVLDFTAKAYRKAYAGSFLAMVNHAPQLWGYLYRSTDAEKVRKVPQKFVTFFDRLEFASFRKFVRGFAPDEILCTHFLPAQVLAPSRKKGKDATPLGLVVTDFDVHSYWVQPTADRVFVGSGELKARLAERGIPEEKVNVTGIPIAQAFSETWDRAAIQQRLGLSTDLPTVLVMSGGGGVGSMGEAVEAVLACPRVQVLAVTGRNETLRNDLASLPVPEGSRLHVFGFVDPIAELMAVSDLAVTKSGGLTTSECLAMGLPMVVRDPIPGQEERNCDYVLEAGAGVKAYGAASLAWKLKTLLSDRDRLARMSEAARRAGRPGAAREIVATKLR